MAGVDKKVRRKYYIPEEQFCNAYSPDLSADSPFDNRTVSNRQAQLNRPHYRPQQTNNRQTVSATQYYQQIVKIVALPLYKRQFHLRMPDRIGIVFVVPGSLFDASQSNSACRYLVLRRRAKKIFIEQKPSDGIILNLNINLGFLTSQASGRYESTASPVNAVK